MGNFDNRQKYGIMHPMKDMESVKAKLREMAEKGGEDALLPSVLLRLLEDGEADRKEAKTQSERIAQNNEAIGELVKACNQAEVNQREAIDALAKEVAAVSPELAEGLRKSAEESRQAGEQQSAKFDKRLSAVSSSLAQFKKAAILAAVVVPVVTVLLALAAFKIFG